MLAPKRAPNFVVAPSTRFGRLAGAEEEVSPSPLAAGSVATAELFELELAVAAEPETPLPLELACIVEEDPWPLAGGSGPEGPFRPSWPAMQMRLMQYRFPDLSGMLCPRWRPQVERTSP